EALQAHVEPPSRVRHHHALLLDDAGLHLVRQRPAGGPLSRPFALPDHRHLPADRRLSHVPGRKRPQGAPPGERL
ncbi:MAG: hypothetical protein AVDCRST_MAG02-4706, partial [uncultured Rubrobacteraceae bacterium]